MDAASFKVLSLEGVERVIQKQGIQCGGIQAIACAQKNDPLEGTTQICIIGHARCDSFYSCSLSRADHRAKDVILRAFAHWGGQERPISFLIPDSREACQHFHQLNQKEKGSPSFYLPMHALIGVISHENNYRTNNIEIIPSRPWQGYSEAHWNPTLYFSQEQLPFLAQQAGLEWQSAQQVDRANMLKSVAQQSGFFLDEGDLQTFVDCIKTRSRLHRFELKKIGEYRQLLAEMLAHTRTLDHPQHAQLIQELSQDLSNAQDEQISFLKAYGIADLNMTLLDALVTIIRAQRSLAAGCIEFQTNLVVPLFQFTNVVNHLAVLETASKSRNLVVLHPFERMDHLLVMLAKSGYAVHSAGPIPFTYYAPFAQPCAQLFDNDQIVAFLTAQFSQPRAIQEELIETDEEAAQARVIKEEPTNEALQLFPLDLNEKDKTFICSSCAKQAKESGARVVLNNAGCTCCTRCFVETQMKEKSPTFWKLLTKTDLARKDPLLLSQIGTLCQLMFYLTTPGSDFMESPFFKLSHDKLITHLDKILSDPAWTKACQIAAELKIDCTHMKKSMETYRNLKESYFQQQLKDRKERAKNRQKSIATIFDQNGVWQRLQEQLRMALAVQFEINGHTSFFARVYYSIILRIAQRIAVAPEKLVLLT